MKRGLKGFAFLVSDRVLVISCSTPAAWNC